VGSSDLALAGLLFKNGLDVSADKFPQVDLFNSLDDYLTFDQRMIATKQLAVCYELSPSDDVRNEFTKLFIMLRVNRVELAAFVQELASALLDGLRHGNWPKIEALSVRHVMHIVETVQAQAMMRTKSDDNH